MAKTMINQINKLGFQQAKAITKRFAKTFYFASLFLPQDKRMAAYSVYAICRISDDSVDSFKDNEYLKNLTRIKRNIELAYSDTKLTDPLLIAFRETINNYSISKNYFDELFYGMNMDLEKTRYQNIQHYV